jgi:hypothetical protein
MPADTPKLRHISPDGVEVEVVPDYILVRFEGPYLERALLQWSYGGKIHYIWMSMPVALQVANCVTFGKPFGIATQPAPEEPKIDGESVEKAKSLTFYSQ